MSEYRFRLGVDFMELGWIRMMAFDGGGAFLPERTTRATDENCKVEPSSFLGSEPSSCYKKTKWNQRRN
jgi:hypothetical protein